MAEIIVFCPRCGSLDAESVEVIAVELDRMRCATCGHSEICDEHEIKCRWNERVPAASAVRERGHTLPSARFGELWGALGAQNHHRPTFERLRDGYDEPHRAYHNACHIGACLRLLDDPAVVALAEAPREVEAALWFHDAIYDTHASDNEERSAVLAIECLGAAGVAADSVERIATYVRATKAHVTDAPDGQLLIDIDLSILGEPAPVYARFEDEIRREYAWVDEGAFAAGRAAVLLRFDEREHIYRTPLFRERYEANARRNIAAAVQKLALDR